MKSPYWPLFQGRVSLRAIGFICLIATSIFCLCLAQTAPDDSTAPAPATASYEIVDLGTLGGSTSSAAGMTGQQGHNAAGMIVGSSAAADNSAHAFLYSNGQMFDLNELCDLPRSNFNVLTVATSIDDAGQIIGEGVTTDGQNHAFLLTPTPVDGGNWSYSCCRWIWKQQADTGATQTQSGSGAAETGWWWESDCHCYKWHGRPGKHPACPTNPPHCWGWPLPCPPDTGCTPHPHSCWCCINGQVVLISAEECRKRGGQCYASQHEAQKHCTSTPTPTPTATPTPTPTPGTQPPKPPGEITKEKFPPLGWCCKNGVVSHISRGMCDIAGGQFYTDEASAFAACGHNSVWCCHQGGNIEIAPPADCLKSGGTCYATQAEALQNCPKPPSKCWCCLYPNTGANPVYVTTDYCKNAGGVCFATQEEAIARCKGGSLCYCCDADHHVWPGYSRAECISNGWQAFDTEADALKWCSTAFNATPVPLNTMQGTLPLHNTPLRMPKSGPIAPPMPQVTPVPNNPRFPRSTTNTPVPQVTPKKYRLPHTPTAAPHRNPILLHDLAHTPTPTPAGSSRSPSSLKHRLPKLKPPPTPPIIR